MAMLHRSFKPAKCKMALKLSVSRIKLLKNKREAHVKQLKRELAQLLESGQDQNASIRVEHVVREEKTLAAYDLIEIYCELIAARLPMIESQKNCPIDLKEAVSSVIFASPRCDDIPELMDVRKHFTAKYGKEFVTAAAELRPDCGVSRLLVEKLSAKAPDALTKIKVLGAIAEEHDVKWDPKSFGEKEMKPPADLLNGPNTFEKASIMHVEPPTLQEPPGGTDRPHPNFGASSKHNEKHDAPVNTCGSKSRSSHYHSNSFTSIDASKAMPSGTSHLDPRPLGTASESMEFRQSYAPGQDSYSASRQSWNMEFKDATAAAQAAAESAEQASMAARAAAELSNQERITRQHSTESKMASTFKSIDEEVQNYVSSRLQSNHIAQDPAHNTTHTSSTAMHYKQSFENKQDDLAGLAERFNNLKSSNKPTHSVSSKSSSSCVGKYPDVSDSHMAERHSRKSSFELEKSYRLGGASMKKESSESESKFAGEVYNGTRYENVGYFEAPSIRKECTSVSPHSQIPADDLDVASSSSQWKFSEEVVNEPYIFDEDKVQRDVEETNAYDNAGVVFDDSGSDDDVYKFDIKGQHNGQDSPLTNSGTKIPRLNMEESYGKSSSKLPFASECYSTSVFSDGLTSDTVPSQADDLLAAATSDDSDGPGSDSEDELNETQLVGRSRTGTSPHKDIAYSSNLETPESPHVMGSSLAEKENVGSSRSTWMQPSAIDSGVVVHSTRNQGIEVGDETDRNLNYGYLHNNQPSHRYSKSQSKFNDDENPHTSGFSSVKDDDQGMQSLNTTESTVESGAGLNLGNLTGGLRNRGYKHPPYRRNPIEKHPSSEPADDSYTRIDQSSSFLKLDIGSGSHDQKVHQKLDKEPSSESIFPNSDARDESDEACPQVQQTFYSSQEPYIQKARTEMNKKSGLGSYFASVNSDSEEDSEEDHPKQAVTSKTHSRPAFSRRTKASLSNSFKSLKSKVPPERSTATDYVAEKKSSSVGPYATEAPEKPQSQTNSSNYQIRSEQNYSPEQHTPVPISQSKRTVHEGLSSRSSSYTDTPVPISQSKRTVHEGLSSRSSYSTDTRQNPSFYSKNVEQRRSAEPYKTVFESRKSSHEENPRASTIEQASNPPPRKGAAGGAGSRTTKNSDGNSPSRENSINKASHVHPKLPDYDTLTAHLLSLRQNRQ